MRVWIAVFLALAAVAAASAGCGRVGELERPAAEDSANR